ncbi:mannose-1-phosphate guanylyltransferase [Thermonema lapsum]|uniref:mannose-1-phosphate guanylyltransferase n=1 Tax=Thermonema lapsum TaxID=28195 RepID=A0A846MRP3_9BACT|nr:mannose-1-phosphate guanylyltransferase [Thermonema lapsum]NIK74129.1 mannose-1-phosphate guanylyltransferase [Thermonema lapsum]
MSDTSFYTIIMAGGVGSRFWPFSREHSPKQFHDILGRGKSMIQETVERFEGICSPENIYVVTHKKYVDKVKEHLPFLSHEQILAEPSRRNTAPCIAYACYKIAQKNPDAVTVVTPADHVIQNVERFQKAIRTAVKHAHKKDVLVTLGIKPNRPDTGYGYIQYQQPSGLFQKFKPYPLLPVKTFTEKPNLELAKKFLESGDFVWNAGIFIWHVESIKKAFQRYAPEIAEVFEEIEDHFFTESEREAVEQAYPLCKKISIDYAIMEKADNVYVIPVDCGWSDLGTWKSLYELAPKDDQQNVIQGTVLAYDSQQCIVKTPKDQLVVIQGLEGFIVAEHEGVLLICRQDQEQRVKEFVAEAKKIDKRFI